MIHTTKKPLMIFIMLIALLSYSHPVESASIAVTKAVMDYKNVLKGGYAEDYVYIATDTEFDVPLSYELIGDISPWIMLQPDLNDTNATVYINKDKIQELKIIIQPPEDTPAGNYSGGIRLITGTINRPEGPYGSQLQAAFLIRINVEVTGTEIIDCNFGGAFILDTEISEDLRFSMVVSNTGNVRIRPTASMDIWNQDQSQLISSLDSDFDRIEILPTTARSLEDSFTNNLRLGQYWGYVQVEPCDQSQLISFSILEKGAIADYGELIRIETPPWVKVGDIVPITAFFKNTGPREVTAKLKGIITLDNRIVENIDSDFYDIAPGEIKNITVFYKPNRPGQHFASGRVLYNNKLSFEKSSIFNATGAPASSNMLYIIIIIITAIIILILLIGIKRKRRGKDVVQTKNKAGMHRPR